MNGITEMWNVSGQLVINSIWWGDTEHNKRGPRRSWEVKEKNKEEKLRKWYLKRWA